MTIDFTLINNQILAQSPQILREWLPRGKVAGREYIALNPTRADNTLGSFKINYQTGVWEDFSGGPGDKGGDLVSLYAYIKGIKQGEAAKQIAEDLNINDYRAKYGPGQSDYNADDWEAIWPVPTDQLDPPNPTFHNTPASGRWLYSGKFCEPIGYTYRFEFTHGDKKRKDVIPYSWCKNKNTGVEQWRFKSFEKPRPLYGLEILRNPIIFLDNVKNPDNAPILLVEGEKTADAAREIFKSHIVMTWPGGGKAVKNTDFAPLKDKSIVIWPDNDDPGKATAFFLGLALIKAGVKAAKIRVVMPPETFRTGWDLADLSEVDWSHDDAKEYLKKNVAKFQTVKHSLEMIAKGGLNQSEPKPDDQKNQTKKITQTTENEPPEDKQETPINYNIYQPFLILGAFRNTYYYMPLKTKQIMEIDSSNHRQNYLLPLAPLEYWYKAYTEEKETRINWTKVANDLIQRSQDKGFFSYSKVRGRGAWWDKGRSVIHLGGGLLVDKEPVEIGDFDSDYIYEAGHSHENLSMSTPLTDNESIKFLQLCERLKWQKDLFGTLFAGWCVVAPICGALKWRPHIWVTGARGTGKTWVVDNIIKMSLGDLETYFQSKTTEAGIRQKLNSDSFPVVFDEADGEDDADRRRIQSVIRLARQASSDTGSKIIMGSIHHSAKEFSVRSCFAFASIITQIVIDADSSRITRLELTKENTGVENRKGTTEFYDTFMTVEYCQRLRARTVGLIHVIRKNAEIFSEACAAHLGSKRDGDQIGALLAGALALKSDKVIGEKQALEWVRKQDWEAIDSIEAAPDEERCIGQILRGKEYLSIENLRHERNVAELIGIARKTDITDQVGAEFADLHLRRMGIKIIHEDEVIIIANNNESLGKHMIGTNWPRNWNKVLARIPGAKKTEGQNFAGVTQRGVSIPMSELPMHKMDQIIDSNGDLITDDDGESKSD